MIRRSNNQLLEKINNRFEHQTKTLLSFDKLKIQSITIEKNDEKILKKFNFRRKNLEHERTKRDLFKNSMIFKNVKFDVDQKR